MLLLCQKRTILIFRMVRNYIRKTSRGLTPGDVIRRALECVSTDGLSIRAAAEKYGMILTIIHNVQWRTWSILQNWCWGKTLV